MMYWHGSLFFIIGYYCQYEKKKLNLFKVVLKNEKLRFFGIGGLSG